MSRLDRPQPRASRRPADSALVRGGPGQLRADGVFLVGGEGRKAKTATTLECKSVVDYRTSGQTGG